MGQDRQCSDIFDNNKNSHYKRENDNNEYSD